MVVKNRQSAASVLKEVLAQKLQIVGWALEVKPSVQLLEAPAVWLPSTLDKC
jgi:hypothetical protein